MKALSVRQPWAAAIMAGEKCIENRSWKTSHRGPLAVHASKAAPGTDALACCSELGYQYDGGSTGAVLGTVELVGMLTPDMSESDALDELVDTLDCTRSLALWILRWWEPGYYGWILARPTPIDPVAASGRLHLWDWHGAC